MILGTYADLKIIKTRSVVQIVVEVPLERGKEVTDLFGLPQPNAEIPVVIARLHEGAVQQAAAPLQIDDDEAGKRKPLSQVSAILCNIVTFRRFLAEKSGKQIDGPGGAADEVRRLCGIESRKQLDTDEVAARHFRNLRSDYDLWMRVPA